MYFIRCKVEDACTYMLVVCAYTDYFTNVSIHFFTSSTSHFSFSSLPFF